MTDPVYAGRDKDHRYNNSRAGNGEQTKFGPHPDYPFKYGSTYFRTEAGMQEFRRVQLLKKAAKRLGWPHSTLEEINRFEKWRNDQREIVELRRKRQKEELEERRKLREEFGLKPSSVLYNYAATMSKQGHKQLASQVLTKQAASKLTPDDKVALIKKMIEERTPIQDFMIKTSQLVGAKL